jgi:ABC-type sugar transport system ATPase subunit
MRNSHAPTLHIDKVTKTYGATRALRKITLEVTPGEIFGIAGPNGAGKSTLIRILGGEEDADSGTITLGGKPMTKRRRHVAVVHQEPQLYPTLSVEENLQIARERHGLRKPRRRMREREILDSLGIGQYSSWKIVDCTLAVRQLVEIARALSRDASVFLFDEPNSALTASESEVLFSRMQALSEAGNLVLFVSHRLGELVDVAKRVAIIREGTCTKLLEGDELNVHTLARQLMATGSGGPTQSRARGEPSASDSAREVLSVTGWGHRRGAFRDIDLAVGEGEILAVIGVEGSGGRELVRSLAGLEAAAPSAGGGPETRAAFLPGDRAASLFPHLSVGGNLVARLGRPRIASSLGFLQKKRAREVASRLTRRYSVRLRSPSQSILELSGGNQQKVACAAAFAADPKILAIEEPTRGVDVSSKADIYSSLREFVQKGGAVVAFCTEASEVFDLADRVAVMHAGAITGLIETSNYAHPEDLAEALGSLMTASAAPLAQAASR